MKIFLYKVYINHNRELSIEGARCRAKGTGSKATGEREDGIRQNTTIVDATPGYIQDART